MADVQALFSDWRKGVIYDKVPEFEAVCQTSQNPPIFIVGRTDTLDNRKKCSGSLSRSILSQSMGVFSKVEANGTYRDDQSVCTGFLTCTLPRTQTGLSPAEYPKSRTNFCLEVGDIRKHFSIREE